MRSHPDRQSVLFPVFIQPTYANYFSFSPHPTDPTTLGTGNPGTMDIWIKFTIGGRQIRIRKNRKMDRNGRTGQAEAEISFLYRIAKTFIRILKLFTPARLYQIYVQIIF